MMTLTFNCDSLQIRRLSLAYLINKHFGINLERKDKDLDLNYTSSSYSVYEWDNEANDTIWNLSC